MNLYPSVCVSQLILVGHGDAVEGSQIVVHGPEQVFHLWSRRSSEFALISFSFPTL